MNQRLIVGHHDKQGIHVYPLLCMDCEGDVFEWVNTTVVQDARTQEYFNLGSYRCVHCGFVHNLDERTFLSEATDETHGWYARRHVVGSVHAKRNDPLNEGSETVSDPSADGR